MIETINIPPEITDAVNRITEWANENNFKSWRLGDICHRSFAERADRMEIILEKGMSARKLFSGFVDSAKSCNAVTCVSGDVGSRAKIELHFDSLEKAHEMHSSLAEIGAAMKDGAIFNL